MNTGLDHEIPIAGAKPGDWLYKAAVAGVLACVVYYLGAIAYITFSRIAYPFALEFAEGDTYVQVYRILHGLRLYERPSYQYVAFDYPPLYFYAGAVLSRIMGLTFLPLRLISFGSAVGCIVLTYLICRQQGVRRVASCVAAGLFAATYHLGNNWFDTARVDMLALLLALLGIYLYGMGTTAAYITAGVVFALSCLVKQTNLLILIPLGVYFILFERGRPLLFLLSSIAVFSVASVGLDRLYGGWYSFYVFKITLGSGSTSAITFPMILGSLDRFWLRALVFPLPVVVALCAVYVLQAAARPRPQLNKLHWFYIFLAAGMLGTGWAALVHEGGANNVLIPTYAGLAILCGLGLQWLYAALAHRRLLHAGLLLLCMIQFGLLRFPVRDLIPTHDDLLAGQGLISRIRSQPGDVYVQFHPEMALKAGKPAFADWVTLYQLEGSFGGGDVTAANRVKVEFEHAMQRHQFSLIILDKGLNSVWGKPEKYYTMSSEPVFASADVYWPVVGLQVRPTFIMVPK